MAWVLLALLLVSFPVIHGMIEFQSQRAIQNAVLKSTQDTGLVLSRFLSEEIQRRLGEILGPEEHPAQQGKVASEALEHTDRFVRSMMMGTNVAGLRFYTPDGLVLYSTHLVPLNEVNTPPTNPIFVSAAQGVPQAHFLEAADEHALRLVEVHLPVRDALERVVAVMVLTIDKTAMLGTSHSYESQLHYYLVVAQTIQLLLLLFIGWVLRGHLLQLKARLRASS